MTPERNYHIILVPSELGCGARGASHGPEAIMYADITRNGDFFNRFFFTRIEDHNYELIHPSPFKHAKYIDHISKVIDGVIDEVEDCFDYDQFPLILSGDHSNAIGTIAAIKNFHPTKRLGVIWIDAHADLHSPYTTPSGNVHGMSLAASLGDVYSSDKINKIDEATKHYWKKLTHAGDRHIHPKLLPEDVVYIDIRDLEAPEWKDINDNKIKYFGPDDIKGSPIKKIAQETLDYLNKCDLIYVSFDVDSMDPSVSMGTGTSVPDGITLPHAKELLSYLFHSPKLIALEITEVNPLVDKENKMAIAVLEILDFLIPKE
ncbi:MAG: arginase [Bacteroidia bacterium]